MRRKLAAVAAVVLTSLIVWASMLPEERRSLIDTRGPLHPYVHLVTFALVAWLAAWSTRSPRLRVVFCIAVALLGYGTELVEWRLFGNPMEWADVVLDAMGAVSGVGMGALTTPRERLTRGAFTDQS